MAAYRQALQYALLMVLFALASPACAERWTAEKQSEAEAIIARFLRVGAGQFLTSAPALSVTIGIDGTLAMADGFGEAAPGHQASADTAYRIGSLTKQFTAAGVLKLIEQGATAPTTSAPLALGMEVTEILGSAARWTQPGQRPITLHSLLTMTSNLPNFTRRPPPHLDPWGAIPATRLLDEVRNLAPSGWPESFEYSNTNYFLLSAVIDAAQPTLRDGPRGYVNLLQRFVFEPAGMVSTGFPGFFELKNVMALPMHRRRPVFDAPDWLRGSGDMVSTARDLFAWNCGLLAGRILSPPSLDAMFAESARVSPTQYYGMGWFIDSSDGWTLYHHTGAVPGYTAFNAIARNPADGHWTSVTLLTNMDGVKDLDGLADELFRLVRRAP